MALLHYNSLIKVKMGICPLCAASVGKQPLKAKGLCGNHYDMSLKMKYLNKAIGKEESSVELRDELDAVFSKFVRLSAADANGIVSCYICDARHRWQNCDAMHFIPRGNMLLRYDHRNVKAGCRTCNQYLDGNLVLYGKRLNEANIGITEVLLEESHLIYHYGRFELLGMIKDYGCRVSELLKQLK